MKLSELKSTWNALEEEKAPKDTSAILGLERLPKTHSRSTLAKIKRSLLFKLWFAGTTLLISSTILTGSFIRPAKFTFFESFLDLTDNRILLVTMVIFLVIILIGNARAFKEIRSFQTKADTIKVSLAHFIGIMERTIRLNIFTNTAFNTLVVGWIGFLIGQRTGIFGEVEPLMVPLALGGLGALLFYRLAQYGQQLKFGRYLDQLKSNLKTLKEDGH